MLLCLNHNDLPNLISLSTKGNAFKSTEKLYFRGNSYNIFDILETEFVEGNILISEEQSFNSLRVDSFDFDESNSNMLV